MKPKAVKEVKGELVEAGANAMALYEQGAKADMALFDEVAASGDFLPRLAVLNSSSKQVTDPELQMRAGHIALIYNESCADDLGGELEFIPLGFRYRAMRTKGEIANYYDPRGAEFLAIKEESKVNNSGAFFGPEFIGLCLPSNRIVTFLFGSNSSRKIAPVLRDVLTNKAVAVIKTKYVTSKTNGKSWWVPVIAQSDTPVVIPEEMMSKISEELHKFSNPTEGGAEGIEETESRSR